MAKGRELKGRIKSVENTRKITKTMEMVATSKMKRAQDRVVAARPYANALTEVISGLYSPELAERFPLLRQPAGAPKRAAVIMVTGNRGLAGAFNSNIIKEARGLLAPKWRSTWGERRGWGIFAIWAGPSPAAAWTLATRPPHGRPASSLMA
jgi:F-type H+-transporting ATPase subunit gamma